MFKRIFLALTALAFVACATVSPDTYKKPGSQYGRDDGWFYNSDGDLYLVTNGTATGSYFDSDGNFTTTGTLSYTSLAVSGAATVGTTSTLTGAVAAASTLTVASQTMGINFADMKIHDSKSTPLTVASGDDDDLTYYEGTFGTNASTLETVDCGGLADTTQYAIFTFNLPASLPTGATVSLVANSGMRTTVASEGATLDFSCYVADYANEDGTMSGDLITTAAQSVNSLTYADKTFALDDDAAGYVLTPGDTIECMVTALCDDDDNLGGEITVVVNRLDVKIST